MPRVDRPVVAAAAILSLLIVCDVWEEGEVVDVGGEVVQGKRRGRAVWEDKDKKGWQWTCRSFASTQRR